MSTHRISYPSLSLILVLLTSLVAGCGGGHETHSPAEPAAVQADLAVAERLITPELVELQGTVVADRVTTLSARITARVTAVTVRDGEAVDRDQILIEIDPQTSGGNEARARGALAQARAGLALAERNYQRFQELAKKDAATELELDTARSHYEQSLAAVEQARGALTSASSVAADARVTAPFAARVSQALVEIGDLVAPGRPLITLESQRGRRLRLSVPERVVRLSAIALGSEIDVAIDSHPELDGARGAVVEMTAGADPSSHSFLVEVALEKSVPTGLVGRASLELGEKDTVAVPATAVIRQGGLEMVAIRAADGRTATRAVTCGRTLDGERVEILSGLAGGEEVLLGLSRPPLAGSPIVVQRALGAPR